MRMAAGAFCVVPRPLHFDAESLAVPAGLISACKQRSSADVRHHPPAHRRRPLRSRHTILDDRAAVTGGHILRVVGAEVGGTGIHDVVELRIAPESRLQRKSTLECGMEPSLSKRTHLESKPYRLVSPPYAAIRASAKR